MGEYRNHRAEPYFSMVKNGQKKIEVRLQKGKYKEIKAGDEITVFTNDETDSFRVKVTDARKYPSFEAMLAKEELSKVLPNAHNTQEAINLIREFYSEEAERQYGVVAIEVQVI